MSSGYGVSSGEKPINLLTFLFTVDTTLFVAFLRAKSSDYLPFFKASRAYRSKSPQSSTYRLFACCLWTTVFYLDMVSIFELVMSFGLFPLATFPISIPIALLASPLFDRTLFSTFSLAQFSAYSLLKHAIKYLFPLTPLDWSVHSTTI